MTALVPPSIETLLAHRDWMRALAQSLVDDPDTADEIAQRTLLAAWRTPPRAPDSIRAWLRASLVNFAASARRAVARRELHEERSARSEAEPSALDVVARASLQRELVEAVLALDEPYRTPILLRYFDERSPAEIARALGIPPATVRTRIARGLARLRARLDRRHSGRDAWTALFLPLVPATKPPLPVAALLVMDTKLKIALPLAAGALALIYFAVRPASPAIDAARNSAAGPATLATPASHPEPREGLAPAIEKVERTGASTTTPKATTAAAAPEPPARVAGAPRGLVLDASHAARSGVELVAKDGTRGALAKATSGADGRFAFASALPACRVEADGANVSTVLSGSHGDSPDEADLVVVVAPARKLAGTVADESAATVADARLSIELPDGFRARFAVPLDRSTIESFLARSDERGAFDFGRAPAIDGARFVAEHDGYERWSEELASVAPLATIVLRRPRAEDGVVRGRVVDASESPVEGARVAFGIDTAKTAKDGGFAFTIADPNGLNARFHVAPERLVAVRAGFQPATFEPPSEAGKPVWPAFVTLKLGAPALAIAGRVEDHDGRSRAGIRVWIADTTTFGAVDDNVAQIESLLAGETKRAWRFVETNDHGEFRIDGLLDRAYAVEAMEDETLLRALEEDVQAGTSTVVLRMPKDVLYPRVAGRVLAHDGTPLQGVSIHPMCDAFRAKLRGETISTSHAGVDGVVTDEEGRFELKNVPKTLVYLRLDGEGILPLEYGRYVEGDPRFARTKVRALDPKTIESLDIQVDRRAHVQIELADASAADEFALLDGEGEGVELSAFEGGGRREGMRQPIVDGRSVVIGGSDSGKTLVLYKQGAEVARTSVKLVPGETKLVRL